MKYGDKIIKMEGVIVEVHFGGIYSAAFVYLNGKYVGYSQGANNVAEFDVTKYLKPGENQILLRCTTGKE